MNNEPTRRWITGNVFKNFLLLAVSIFPFPLYAQYMSTVAEGNHTVVRTEAGLHTYIDKGYTIYCDTLLNGLNYKKVWQDDGVLLGFVREDTLQKEVYYLEESSTVEKLVAKYGLSIGDTFHYPTYPHLYVDSIYTDFRFGKNRTIWRGNMDISGAMGLCETVEGIGVNQWGIIPKIRVPNMVGFINVFENTGNTCNTLDVKENAVIRPTIYPNPAADKLEIIFPETALFPFAIELYDVSGRKCMAQSAIRQSTLQLNVSTLSPGSYVLHIQNSQNVQSVLVIKQ